jgi:predicted small lipoprotein YifL
MKISIPGPRTARLAILAALLLTIALLAACGKKGPVRPQLASLPAAPADLRIDQQGDDFLLSWAIPERNQDGAPAEDLSGFHLYRLVYNAAEGCPTCRDPEELLTLIELRRPEPAQRLGKRLYWRDAAVAPGTGHAYLVVPVTIGGREGTGAAAFRAWQQPPAPPLELRAEAGDRQVRLSWSPPPALPEGQLLLGYNLYRRAASGVFPPVPLNAEPLREPRLTDFVGEAGREAVYRVTTLARAGDQLIESAPSAESAAAPPGAR